MVLLLVGLLAAFCLTGCHTQNSLIDDPPKLFSYDCCLTKRVGNHTYTQVPGDTKKFEKCIKDCVYKRDGDSDPDARYCFQKGGLKPQPVACTESSLSSSFVNTKKE